MHHVNMTTGFLPVHDRTMDEDCRDGHGGEPSWKCERLSRLTILKLLYFLIDHVIQPLDLNVLEGSRIEAADNML